MTSELKKLQNLPHAHLLITILLLVVMLNSVSDLIILITNTTCYSYIPDVCITYSFQPPLQIVSFKRPQLCIDNHGDNCKAMWKPDSSMIAVTVG